MKHQTRLQISEPKINKTITLEELKDFIENFENFYSKHKKEKILRFEWESIEHGDKFLHTPYLITEKIKK